MITQQELKGTVRYHEGELLWLDSKKGVAKGSRAGSISKAHGHRDIRIKNHLYFEHRLVWLYHNGYFPELDIDHINGDRQDNRIENLREVSRSCNLQNMKKSKANKTGFPGVFYKKELDKFQAYITVRKKRHYLGYYVTALEAALARFTEEVWNPEWTCNQRSKLTEAIMLEWPEFQA